MVGDEHANSTLFQITYQMPDIADRNRIHACERFIQQEVFGICSKTACDLDPASFPARQSERRCAAQVFDREIGKQLFQPFTTLVGVLDRDIQNRRDVVLYRQTTEDRHLLRQISDTHPRPAIHRQRCCVLPVDGHGSGFGKNEPRDCVKAGCLARSVRPKKSDDLTAVQRHRNIADHDLLAVGLAQLFNTQARAAFSHCKRWFRHQSDPPFRIVLTRPDMLAVPVVRFTTRRFDVSVPVPWLSRTLPVMTTVPESMVYSALSASAASGPLTRMTLPAASSRSTPVLPPSSCL
mmetsp:Transcript_24547/g.32050  ORF Transcript_24547/g.32050 Transcript_24547/m.32050 type:complete len:293 (-) Transcript_24547:1332-2210(-)